MRDSKADLPMEQGTVIGLYVIGSQLTKTPNSIIYNASLYGAWDGPSDPPAKIVFKYIRPETDPEFIAGELTANKELIHCPNVATGFDFVPPEKGSGFFMKKFTSGDLINYVWKNNSVGEAEIARMLHPIVAALEYMHSIGYVHRDVKPDNIFLDPPNVLLADFGNARKLDTQSKEHFTRVCGSRMYMAPELIGERPYDEKVDIWAFGVTVYVLAARDYPFPNEPRRLEYAIQKGQWFRKKLRNKQASERMRSLISRCLAIDPDKRPSASELQSDPFFVENESNSSDVKPLVGEVDRLLNCTDDDQFTPLV